MKIQEASSGVAHQHPRTRHLPPHLADTKITGGLGSDLTNPVQDLAPEVGRPSRHDAKDSAGPAGGGGLFTHLKAVFSESQDYLCLSTSIHAEM